MAGDKESDLPHGRTGLQDREFTPAPRSELIKYGQHDLLEKASRAEHSDQSATEQLLTSVQRLREQGLLKDVAAELKQSGNAVVRMKDGEPVSIDFFPGTFDMLGRPVHVDLARDRVNNRTFDQLHQARIREANRLTDAKVDAPNRLLPSGETTPLTDAQKAVLKTVEHALVSGDLDAMKKAFQADPNNGELWRRIGKEVQQDLMNSASFEMGKTPDGKPFMALSAVTGPGVVIPDSGDDLKVFNRDAYGRVEYGVAQKYTNYDAAYIMKDMSRYNLYIADQEMNSIKRNFDENKPWYKLRGSFKTMVESENETIKRWREMYKKGN